MGEVRKIKDEYFIEFFARGLKYQQKAGPSKEHAEKLLEEIEAKIATGEASLIVRDVEYDIFFQDFREFIRDKHTSRTQKRYESTIEAFTFYLHQECPRLQRLSEITPRVIEQFKSYLFKGHFKTRRTDPHIINFTLLLLRDIFQYAIKLSYLNDNPVLHIRFLAQRKLAWLLPLGEEETQILLKSTPNELKVVVEFLLLTGISLRQLIHLRWEHVDWKNDQIFVPAILHSSSLRFIPMDARIQMILKTADSQRLDSPWIFVDPSHQKWQLADLHQRLTKVFGKCPLSKLVTLSRLRHTFAVGLLQKGVAFSLLYKMLGKTDIAKMMIYFDFLPLREAAYEG